MRFNPVAATGRPAPGFLDRLLEHRRLARLEIAAELTG
jgi:hypothetical protein